MYEGPEFRHLTTFVAIAEECNFTRAAERLHLAQPAVTSHIKHLEDGLRANLFRRVPAGAELTEAGRNFLPFARQMLQMRKNAVKAASRNDPDADWPLRLGYSPYVNHDLLIEALHAYNEIVPSGRVVSSSDCTAQLTDMLLDGRLDAAIVTMPVSLSGFAEHVICKDKVMICMRKDDACAMSEEVSKEQIAEKLRVLFNRNYHPELHQYVLRKFRKAGVSLNPSETYSAPSEIQFLVKTRGCFGLIRQGVALDPDLTVRPMAGISLTFTSALVYRTEQQRPVLPMLAYRMARKCVAKDQDAHEKKPIGSVRAIEGTLFKKVG